MSAMMRSLRSLRVMDLYPKFPADILQEASFHGSILSFFAFLALVSLLLYETSVFLHPTIRTQLLLDTEADEKIRINFNVSMLALPCEYVVTDMLDSLGARQTEATLATQKYDLDRDGNRITRKPVGHTLKREQKITSGFLKRLVDNIRGELESQDGYEEILMREKMFNKDLTEASFDKALRGLPWVFVFFYMDTCPYCLRMMSEWTNFANEARKSTDLSHLIVARVDCRKNINVCRRERIRGVPTLRLYHEGRRLKGDFRMDRTTENFMAYVRSFGAGNPASTAYHTDADDEKEAVGCLVVGGVIANRVPGNFHIEARAAVNEGSIRPEMANLSHVINTLTFGPPLRRFMRDRLDSLPEQYVMVDPLKDTEHIDAEPHTVSHHYMNAVGTKYYFRHAKEDTMPKYDFHQVVADSQPIRYGDGEIPELKFIFDVSPVGMSVEYGGRRWYEYITNMLGIVGGALTFIRLIHMGVDGVIHNIKAGAGRRGGRR